MNLNNSLGQYLPLLLIEKNESSNQLGSKVLALAIPHGEIGEVLSNEGVENVDLEDGVFDGISVRPLGFGESGINLLGVIEDGIKDGYGGELDILSPEGLNIKKVNLADGLDKQREGLSLDQSGSSWVSQGQLNRSDIEGPEIELDLELEVREDVEVEGGLDQ